MLLPVRGQTPFPTPSAARCSSGIFGTEAHEGIGVSFRKIEHLVILGLVLVLHGGLLAFVVLHKVNLQNAIVAPLFVDFIEAQPIGMAHAAPQPTIHKHQPRAAPEVMRPKVKARSHQLPLESSTSSAPITEATLVGAQADSKAAASHTAGSGASGNAEVQARFDADYLKNPPPTYPPISRRMGEEGKVTLRVLVSPEGTAQQVDIKTSSGSSRLDNSAQRTVRGWKFIPAKRLGIAVESWVLVPILFKLEQ